MGANRTGDRQRLPHAEVQRIAAQIARAAAAPRPNDPRTDILARRFELPPEDEGRVIAARRARRAGAPPWPID